MAPVKIIALTAFIGFFTVFGLLFYLTPDAPPPLLKAAGYEAREPLTQQELELEAKIPSRILIGGFNRTTFKEQYIARLVLPLRQLGRHHKFIDQKVIIEIDSKEILKHRDRRLKYYRRNDTNKDGSITEEELLALIPDQFNQDNLSDSEKRKLDKIKSQIEKILRADTNGDRTIDLEEIQLASQDYALNKPRTKTQRIAELLTLDPNKDGKLTFTELANLGVEAFDYYDDNGDAVIDSDEFKRVKTAKVIAEKRNHQREQYQKYLVRLQACELPEPGDHDKIYVIGAREGSAISTVSVSGQDRETTTGTIEIEPGVSKIYIYATTFEGMIWQIKGASKRISHLVLTHQRKEDGVGVIGVDKSKITFLTPGDCIKNFNKETPEVAKQAQKFIKDKFGRHATEVIGGYKIAKITLPSVLKSKNPSSSAKRYIVDDEDGTYFLKNGEKRDIEELWAKDLPTGSKAHPETVGIFREFTPDGVVNLNHASIIASKNVEIYQTLPSYAGLIQLMENGHLERVKYRTYRITSEFSRFPAELNGGRSVNFILPKEVSMPQGNPGHSCIYLAETGKPIEGSSEHCDSQIDITAERKASN